MQNLDDELQLRLDGDTVLSVEIEPNERQEASITLGLRGEGAELTDLQVFRDVYYLPHRGDRWEVSIPEGHYVMLGDNTQDSADSRDWEAVTFHFDDGASRARGNYRAGGENPAYGTDGSGTKLLRFKDEWGEVRCWLAQQESRQDFPGPAPLVPPAS